MENRKKVVIIGGGVAGLTAALELLRQSDQYEPIIIEQEKEVGGIARTLKYKDYRMDIGGHRFFSKDERVIVKEQHKVKGGRRYCARYMDLCTGT